VHSTFWKLCEAGGGEDNGSGKKERRFQPLFPLRPSSCRVE